MDSTLKRREQHLGPHARIYRRSSAPQDGVDNERADGRARESKGTGAQTVETPANPTKNLTLINRRHSAAEAEIANDRVLTQ